MRSALSSCRLYSWMRLIWQSKMRVRVHRLAGGRFEPVGKLRLGLALGLAEGVAKVFVVGQRLQFPQAGSRSVIQPSPMASVIVRASGGIGQQQPAPRRDAVGLVAEAFGEHLGQVLDRHRAQQSGMDRGHAVGAVRADDGQVGHADLALGAFLDQAHALHAALVAGKAGAHVVQQPAVDLVDDLQVPRQQHLEPGDRPFLQRLGQQRVVRVGQGPLGDVPGLVPAELAPRPAGCASARARPASGACR